MKALIKSLTLIAVSSLFLFYGCEKNPTDPEEITKLTDTEQMEIIAAEVSENDGGIMADIQMASTTASENPGGLAKTTGFDTTFTNNWVTFSVNLSFYNASGVEQERFVQNSTDKLVYKSAVTGKYDPISGLQEIDLSRSTNLDLTGITTGRITSNGTSVNSSAYSFSGIRINLEATSQSTFTITNLMVDSNSPTYLPLSGRLEAQVKGTYNKETLRHNKDVEYNINFTIEFNGGNEVKVTLASGTSFTLNIVTGEVTE